MSMKSLYMNAAVMGMMALMDNYYDTGMRTQLPESKDKIVKHHTGKLEHYTYDDGFECDAYSQELADKKHNKWWNNVGRYKQ